MEDLRLADLSTFLAVARLGSISGVARTNGITPSQVSKAIARLEQRLGVQLLARGPRGISVSEAGRRLQPELEEVLSRIASLRGSARQTPPITVVATAFQSALLLPSIVKELPDLRVRSLEMPPGVASAFAGHEFFDIALTVGGERWPNAWVRTPVGLLRKGLFATPAHARRLGAPPIPPTKVRGETFVCPIYGLNGQVVPGDDGCPLPIGERKIGHETETLSVALMLAAEAEQLVFAPVLAARRWVDQGALTEVQVAGWDVRDPVDLMCHSLRVRARVQRAIVEILRKVLAD
jgi:DNA-binding transcriptional LysR family regulator